MMTIRTTAAIAVALTTVLLACHHPSTTATGTGPATTPTSAPATSPTTAAAGSPAGARPPQRARVRLSPDSLSKLRSIRVREIMATIAGRENEPAGKVFKNVKLTWDMPAGQFIAMMDTTFGRSLGWNCTNCHVITDYASDSKHDKEYARTMITMTKVINAEHMPKINPKDPPKATCMSCHRGVNIPTDSIDLRLLTPVRPPG